MKFQVFIFLAYLLAVTVAEPPVGNGYPSNHHHDHYANDYQRSTPSQDYGPPSPQTFGPSQDFGQARSLNTAYGPPNPNLAQEYGPPSLRNGVSQEYGPPGLRNGPGSRNPQPSSEYGLPNEIPEVMDSYSAPIHGVVSNPSSRIADDYEVPNLRDSGLSSPSQEYGTPFRSNPSQKYGPPNSRSYTQQSTANSIGFFDSSKGFSRGINKNYGPPKSVSTFNSPSLKSSSSNQYLPASKSSDEGYSSSYSSQRDVASPSFNYGVPSQTSAIASSYQSPRALSTSYGVPRASGVADSYGPPAVEPRVPSQQYGVPERSSQGQGYNYGSVRKALEELQNQEPANYDFGYKVNDYESGSDFGHTESRQNNRAEGSYFVLLPDGTKQTVQYEADERGFKPRISVEAVNDGSAGYDDNAANVQARNGPY